jgi:ankyrin repeat protein
MGPAWQRSPFAKMTFDEAHRLIKRGQIAALEKAIPSSLDPNTTNEFGWTLLMLTALEGNTNIGVFLLAQGADVAALNNFGENALSLAAHKGHLPFVKLLKAHGASGAVWPHGHALEEWLRMASGLPKSKIDAIMQVV